MAKDVEMTPDQFGELVDEVGEYLYKYQSVELNRKAWFAMGACVAGGFYAGVRAHIWWAKQKRIAKKIAEQSQ